MSSFYILRLPSSVNVVCLLNHHAKVSTSFQGMPWCDIALIFGFRFRFSKHIVCSEKWRRLGSKFQYLGMNNPLIVRLKQTFLIENKQYFPDKAHFPDNLVGPCFDICFGSFGMVCM